MFSNRLYDVLVAVCFILLLALIAAKVGEDNAVRLTGRFVAADGDSLVQDGRRLRLLGIDAPELAQTCRLDGTEWPCGKEARKALSALVSGRDVLCRGAELDKYGRLLVRCHRGDEDLNAAMVRSGLALAYGAYEREEEGARAQRLGLWAGDFALPSEWRRRHGGRDDADEVHKSGFDF